jgi:hypothetical protein
MSTYGPPGSGPSGPPPAPGYQYAPVAAPPPSRRASSARTVVTVVGIVAVLVLLLGGTATGLILTGRTPSLADATDDSTVKGGQVVVSGVAHNTGKGDATGVVVTVKVTLNGTLTGTANIGAVPAGGSVPYKVTVDTGSNATGTAIPFTAQPSWDEASLDLAGDHYDASVVNGHGIVVHQGSVHNSGAAPAPNAVVAFDLTSDKDGKNVLAHSSQSVGNVPAGGDVPYNVSIDLGANPAQSWYAFYDVEYDEPTVALEQTTSATIGGTMSITGFLANRGQADADSVIVTKSVLDAAGKPLASGHVALGNVAPGKRIPYTVQIDLGQVSRGDIARGRSTYAWDQTRFLFLHEHKQASDSATVT